MKSIIGTNNIFTNFDRLLVTTQNRDIICWSLNQSLMGFTDEYRRYRDKYSGNSPNWNPKRRELFVILSSNHNNICFLLSVKNMKVKMCTNPLYILWWFWSIIIIWHSLDKITPYHLSLLQVPLHFLIAIGDFLCYWW